MKLSVVGLGKLGMPLAAVLASRGHGVIGVDTDLSVVQRINSGEFESVEPGLNSLLRSNQSRIRVTTDYSGAITETDATFILVPTPADNGHPFSLTHVLEAVDNIGAALKKKDGYHLVVLMSTVLPGSTDGLIRPRLEATSGKTCGPDFGLCHCPEFVAVGNVIHDMLSAEYVLAGSTDDRSAQMLTRIFETVCDKETRIVRMSSVNAEIAKLAINNFLTLKISFANMLSETCQTIPGGDALIVAAAAGLDSRIGAKFLQPATGYGGPCFPRDNLAWRYLAETLGVSADLIEAAERINQRQVGRLANLVVNHLVPDGRVAILGLTYKPETDVVEHSQGMALVRELLLRGIEISVYDPIAASKASNEFTDKVAIASSADECIQGANVVVVTVPWKEFRNISPHSFAASGHRPSVIDCWGVLERTAIADSANFVALGACA